MRPPRSERDLDLAALFSELRALLDKLEEEHPEDARAVLLFARARAARFGGSTVVTPADLRFLLRTARGC
jgi:hypothetical protein